MVQNEVITDMVKFIEKDEETKLMHMENPENLAQFVWGLGYVRINTQEAFFVTKENNRAMMLAENKATKTMRIILSGIIPSYKDLLNCIESYLSSFYNKVIINCVDSSKNYRTLFQISSEYICSSYENKNKLVLDCEAQRILSSIEFKTKAPLSDRAYFTKGEFKTLLFATEGIILAVDLNNKTVMHPPVNDEDGYIKDLKEIAMQEVGRI